MDDSIDLFASTLSLSAHEISSLVSQLEDQRSSEQIGDTLKALRRSLKRCANHVPLVCQTELFSQLERIVSQDFNTSCLSESLWLLVDIIAGTPHLDSKINQILPLVVQQMGHESQDVRRAALRVLHVHMRHTDNLAKILDTLVEWGVDSRDAQIQRGVVSCIPLLIGEEFSQENLFPLVNALLTLLVRADNQLFYPCFLSVQRLHSILGNHVFRQYLTRVDKQSQQLYESVLSRNPSAESERQTLGEQQPEQSYLHLNELRFGLFKSHLVETALEGSHEQRTQALESMRGIIRETQLNQLMLLLDQMDSFLLQLICPSLQEHNLFKVSLISLDIIEILVQRIKTPMTQFLPTIVSLLAKRFGDSRVVIRDSVVKVIHHLMYSFPPQDILDLLLAQKPSKSPKVREEVVNRVTAAVLTFPRSEFSLAKLCFAVSPMLTDNRRSVRLAALECLSVLAQALGPKQISPLLSAVEAIESTCQLDGLVLALQARLARRALPHCNQDGSVRYVLNPQHFSGWFSSNEPDLEWVMMATPSSTGGTPPSKKGVSNGGVPPLTDIPFDRRKSYGKNFLQIEDEIQEMGRRKSMAETNIDKLLSSGQTDEFSQERQQLDSFRGVSFQSGEAEEDIIRRDSDESLEVWRQYFSRFRHQLAQTVLNENEFKGHHRSETDLLSYEQTQQHSQRHSPPPLSSSAPSTASLVEQQQHIRDQHVHFDEEEEEEIVLDSNPVFALERSMSLPSITREEQQFIHSEKPSPFLATPLLPMEPIEAQDELKVNSNELSSEPPVLSVQEATPLHERRSSSVAEPKDNDECIVVSRLDVWTQKDETLSSETSEDIGKQQTNNNKREERVVQRERRKRAQPIGRQSRSQSPRRRPSRLPQQIYIKTTPAIAANANIRNILANVAKTEGPFDSPIEALKAAILALNDDAWTTKVEGMLAITRLATFHAHCLLRDQHVIVLRLIQEVKNLRSTVSRSAIFTLGELFSKLKVQIEPEMDSMVTCLVSKSAENVVFIREDIERALNNCLEEMPKTRTALALIQSSNHRNALVRRTSAQFLSTLVEQMGPIKCLLGPRDIGEHLLPAVARFVQDQSPHTRYYGRKMFSVLMNHVSFEKLLRKHVTPGTYRNIVGILESIKRRGIGDRPHDMSSPQ